MTLLIIHFEFQFWMFQQPENYQVQKVIQTQLPVIQQYPVFHRKVYQVLPVVSTIKSIMLCAEISVNTIHK